MHKFDELAAEMKWQVNNC